MAADLEPHPASVWEALADRIGDAEALVQGDVHRTWAEFDDRAGRLAAAFEAAGLGPGSKVGHLLYNSPEYLETYFATLKVEGVPFNVNYRYLGSEIAYLLTNADAEALVFHASLGDRIASLGDELAGLKLLVEVDDDGTLTGRVPGAVPYDAVLAGHEPAARRRRDPDGITMTYTGGTTGMPKGVMGRVGTAVEGLLVATPAIIGEQAVASPAEAVEMGARRVAEGTQWTSLAAPPLMHATAMGIAATPTLLFGGRLVVLPTHHLDAAELWDVVEREHVNAIVVVGDPFARPMLEELEANPGRDLSSVRIILSSGAMFSSEIKAGLLDHLPGIVISDLIASTEGTMGMAISMKGAEGMTGRFTAGAGVITLDEDGRPIPRGSDQPGLVAVPGGALGYFKDEAKTAATFKVIDGVRYTLPGDFGILAEDGSLTLLGRGSQCINTAGEKVFPEEVEEALKRLPSVEDALVFGVPDERFGQRVVAVVGPSDPTAPPVPDEVVDALRGELASYKLPRSVVVVDEAPRTAVGKPDYPTAKQLFADATGEAAS